MATLKSRIFLALGAALLTYLLVRLGLREVFSQMVELRWTLVPILVLYAGHQAARAWAFTCCLPEGHRLTVPSALAIRLSGEAVQFLTFTGPVLAEPAKAVMLRRHGLSAPEALATTLAEYLASSLAAAVMAVVGLGYVLWWVEPRGSLRAAALVIFWAMLAFVLLFGIGVGLRLPLIGSAARRLARLPFCQRLQPRLEGLRKMEDVLIGTLGDNLGRLAKILGLETLGQLCLGVELWTLLQALGHGPGLPFAMLVEGSTKFITAGYFFVPGQVGVAEGSYAVVFTAFGLTAQAGVAVSLVRRLRSMATAAIGLAQASRLSKQS